MNLYELQNAGNKATSKFFQQMIDDKIREWGEKKIDESQYHSQLSILYGEMYNSEACKKHAGLMPGWSEAQEKTGALNAVARILVYEKKIEEALDYYQQAFALDPGHEISIEEAGWCCLELKQWEQAEDWFTKGTLLKEDTEPFWEGLGLTMAQQKKYEEALPAFKKGREQCHILHGYYYDHLIGQCYANLNDFYRALGHYTKCLDANPTYTNALNDIATLYFNEEGDMDTAINYLKKAEAIAESNKEDSILQLIYMNLSRIYRKIKEFELHQYYHAKMMEKLGFGSLFNFNDDEDEED